MLKCSIATILVTLLVSSLPTLATAQSSKAQCTCDLKGNDKKNGAQIHNTRSCWSTEYADREWCDIDIDELDASSDLGGFVNRLSIMTASGDSLADLFNNAFSSYLSNQLNDDNPTIPPDRAQMIQSVLEPSLFNAEEELRVCALDFVQFLRVGDASGAFMQTDGFICYVASDVGWLHVSVVGDGTTLTLHLSAPR